MNCKFYMYDILPRTYTAPVCECTLHQCTLVHCGGVCMGKEYPSYGCKVNVGLVSVSFTQSKLNITLE
jgi:hypothetical protein